MKQIKKTGLLLFILSATQIMSLSAQSSISVQLKETNKLSLGMYENLIMFVLTKDTVYHNKAMAIVDSQNAVYRNLKTQVQSGSIYETLVSAYLSTGEACKTLYDKYYRERIVNDNEKTKELKYEGQTYNVSKFRQKEFNDLLADMKKEQKRYK